MALVVRNKSIRVPQGSVLGPLLFLLYIDDLHSIVRHSELKLYADDVALYREIKSEADCQLLQDLDHICDWANKWQLRLNASKCEALISNKRRAISFEYFVNHSPLAWRSTVKYLGVLHAPFTACSVQTCLGPTTVNMCQPKPAKL